MHEQSFCERLFARVQAGGSVRYETRLLLLTLLSRVAGMHRCLLLNLFPYLQKYIQPHQRDVTTVLAALVQVLPVGVSVAYVGSTPSLVLVFRFFPGNRRVRRATTSHPLTPPAHAQATHDQVPPDAITPVLRQLCDGFVHDTARPEAMAVGLKTVRELCLRCPLVISPELLQVRPGNWR